MNEYECQCEHLEMCPHFYNSTNGQENWKGHSMHIGKQKNILYDTSTIAQTQTPAQAQTPVIY